MMHLRWGVVGTGHIAHIFVRDLLSEGFPISGIGSRTAERGRSAAAGLGLPWGGAVQELMKRDDVDAIYVASPHATHAQVALDAIDHSKHVLVEKPFAMSAREAEAVFAAARANERVAMEAMWTRYLPHMVEFRRRVSAEIGDITAVVSDLSFRFDPTHRVFDRELGGSALLDLAVYGLALAIELVGPADEVSSWSRVGATGVDEETTLTIRHRAASSITHAAIDSDGSRTAVIFGRSGVADIGGTWNMGSAVTIRPADSPASTIGYRPVPGVRGLQHQIPEFECAVIAGGGEPGPSAEALTMEVLRVVDIARASVGLER